jgi:hypothetical protein
MIKNDEDYLIRRTYTNYGGVKMAFDLSDEELQATREMNKTAWKSELDKWSREYLIERYKDLVEIEKEHKKENGELREKVKELEKYENYYKNERMQLIPKSKVAEILKQRLKKYQDADDGRYKQEYLTRGELELVDRYKECSELLKILCKEDIYKIELDYIPKSKVRVLIEKYRAFGWHNKDDEYWANRILDGFEKLLEERN